MKITDITNKDELDEALESWMALATGSLSDREIIQELRATGDVIEHTTTPPEAGPSDTVTLAFAVAPEVMNSAASCREVVAAVAWAGTQIMPPARVAKLLDRKADEYEEEIA